MARLIRLIFYACAIGGVLLLLDACARQEEPTLIAESTGLSASTAIPTHAPVSVSSASPTPAIESAAEPVTPPPSITEPAPSTADLAIEVIPGATNTYTLTVHNLGPDPATGIVLTDVLSNGAIPLWTEPAPPVCWRQGRDVGCDVGAVQAGDAVTVTLDLSVGGAEAPITGTQLAGVSLDLPAATCTLDRESSPAQITCHLSRLQAGAEAQVRVGIGADDLSPGALFHTAAVVAQEADPDPSNNRVTSDLVAGVTTPPVVTTVPSAADLVIQAEGPTTVTAGRPFTYTYVITNQGESEATGAWFQDAVPSDMNLVAYAPGLPRCERRGDLFTCYLRDADSGEAISLTLRITGYGQQPMLMSLDPLLPGWPICTVIKERTWLHIVQCELGTLAPGQATRVQLVLEAIGVVERTSANTATVLTSEEDLNPIDNTITTTITIQVDDEGEGG